MLESLFAGEGEWSLYAPACARSCSDLLRTRPAEEAVMLAWPLVCGKEVAARTRAVSFSEGSLIVEVPDTAWRNQLQSFVSKVLSAATKGCWARLCGACSSKCSNQQSAISSRPICSSQQSAISSQPNLLALIQPRARFRPMTPLQPAKKAFRRKECERAEC